MAGLGAGSVPAYGSIQGQVTKNTTGYGTPPPAPPVYGTPTRTTTTQAQSTTAPNAQHVRNNSSGYPLIQQPAKPAPAAKPAGGATSAAAAPVPGPAAPAQAPLYDPNVDPVYQQVQAQALQAKQDAEAAATAGQNQLAIQYSDPTLALDEGTRQAAAGNPYGVLGVLQHQQPLDEQALDENLNKSNLYYSGARVSQQGELANNYLQKRADATAAEQTALAQIQSTKLAALLSGQQGLTQANSDAYNRYLTQLLASGTPVGGDTAPAAAAPLSQGGYTLTGPGALAGVSPVPTGYPAGTLTAGQKAAAAKVGLTPAQVLAQALASSSKQSRLG